MRKRVFGAGLLVAIGVGIWLSQFKGLGPGGDGDGFNLVDNASVNVRDSEAVLDGSGSSDTKLPAGAVPTVLVDGHQYLLQTDGGAEESFRPVAISEIVRLTQEAQPGADGIRLHVKRRQSSRVVAEDTLATALREAGVDAHAINVHSALVE